MRKGSPPKTPTFLLWPREDRWYWPEAQNSWFAGQQLELQPRRLSSVCCQGCPDGLKSRWYKICLDNFKYIKHNTTLSVQMKIIREGKYFFSEEKEKEENKWRRVIFLSDLPFSQPLIPSVVLLSLNWYDPGVWGFTQLFLNSHVVDIGTKQKPWCRSRNKTKALLFRFVHQQLQGGCQKPW